MKLINVNDICPGFDCDACGGAFVHTITATGAPVEPADIDPDSSVKLFDVYECDSCGTNYRVAHGAESS